MLREKNISYVVVGSSSVDLKQAVHLLSEHFGIEVLLLEGGGHINGGFLDAGLVDEVSLLLLPGIDGRHDRGSRKCGHAGLLQRPSGNRSGDEGWMVSFRRRGRCSSGWLCRNPR